jgi:hypothetical protein
MKYPDVVENGLTARGCAPPPGPRTRGHRRGPQRHVSAPAPCSPARPAALTQPRTLFIGRRSGRRVLERLRAHAAFIASPGRHCHSTLSLTAIGCHSLVISTVLLLLMLSFSVKMTVPGPLAVFSGPRPSASV